MITTMTNPATTSKRAEASRHNGRKSRGPKTAEGKSRSRFNALNHGMRAKTIVLPGEDADFHTFGGYLMARLNRVPMVADRVAADNYRFEVVEMDGRRVHRVLVTPIRAKGRR